MDKNLKAHIEYLLCIKISKIRSLSGGSISQAFLLESDTERFFCKINRNKNAYTMFLAEKKGLEAISRTNTIATPKVLVCESLENGAFLLMHYVDTKHPSTKDMEALGHKLAALHAASNTKMFGWETDNFIGNLPQSNKSTEDWSAFYALERLMPQLQMALDGGGLRANEIPSETRILTICELFFPKTIVPALLHGDLWGGNYLIAKEGTPYLIDPATYYGHSEVDIAMSRLFGGFTTTFYKAYEERAIKIGGEKERSDLYQLYYLLVHLNLFGGSYRSSCIRLLHSYF